MKTSRQQRAELRKIAFDNFHTQPHFTKKREVKVTPLPQKIEVVKAVMPNQFNAHVVEWDYQQLLKQEAAASRDFGMEKLEERLNDEVDTILEEESQAAEYEADKPAGFGLISDIIDLSKDLQDADLTVVEESNLTRIIENIADEYQQYLPLNFPYSYEDIHENISTITSMIEHNQHPAAIIAKYCDRAKQDVIDAINTSSPQLAAHVKKVFFYLNVFVSECGWGFFTQEQSDSLLSAFSWMKNNFSSGYTTDQNQETITALAHALINIMEVYKEGQSDESMKKLIHDRIERFKGDQIPKLKAEEVYRAESFSRLSIQSISEECAEVVNRVHESAMQETDKTIERRSSYLDELDGKPFDPTIAVGEIHYEKDVSQDYL